MKKEEIWTMEEGMLMREWVRIYPQKRLTTGNENAIQLILHRAGHSTESILEKWRQTRLSMGLPEEPPMTKKEAVEALSDAIYNYAVAYARDIEAENDRLRMTLQKITEVKEGGDKC